MNGEGKQGPRYVVCVNNKGYEASLEAGKCYRVIPDDEAASHGYTRVIDESGGDYGYSVRRFFPIDVPDALEKALASATVLQVEDTGPVRSASGGRKKFKHGLAKVRKAKPRATHRV
jgi:hypothetical protein